MKRGEIGQTSCVLARGRSQYRCYVNPLRGPPEAGPPPGGGTFLYREDEVGGASDQRQYGLLAEEVAKLAPDLVRFDEEGEPFSVHYEQLAPMLLNEVQKQQRTIETLLARVEELERSLGAEQSGTDR